MNYPSGLVENKGSGLYQYHDEPYEFLKGKIPRSLDVPPECGNEIVLVDICDPRR